jgi:hypothetical protein
MNQKIKTLDMEIAIMDYLGVQRNIVVPNISWSMLNYEADLVSLTKSNYGTEIEIKVSKQDLLKDREKTHQHDSNYFKYLYFAVPEDMKDYALQNIPERAGLLVGYWREGYVNLKSSRETKPYLKIYQERSPIENKKCVKWSEKERQKLCELGTMRISTMKKALKRKHDKIAELNEILKEQDIMIGVADKLIREYELVEVGE